MNCEDILTALSARHDHESSVTGPEVAHLAECSNCAEFDTALDSLDRELQELDPIRPSTGFAARTARRITAPEVNRWPAWGRALRPILAAVGTGSIATGLAASSLQPWLASFYMDNSGVRMSWWIHHLPAGPVPGGPFWLLLAGLACLGLPALARDVRRPGKLATAALLRVMLGLALLGPLLLVGRWLGEGIHVPQTPVYARLVEGEWMALMLLGLPLLILRSLRGMPAVTVAFTFAVLGSSGVEVLLGHGTPVFDFASVAHEATLAPTATLLAWLAGWNWGVPFLAARLATLPTLLSPDDLVGLTLRTAFAVGGAAGAMLAGVLTYSGPTRRTTILALATAVGCLLLLLCNTPAQWSALQYLEAPLLGGGAGVVPDHERTVVLLRPPLSNEPFNIDYPFPGRLMAALADPTLRPRLEEGDVLAWSVQAAAATLNWDRDRWPQDWIRHTDHGARIVPGPGLVQHSARRPDSNPVAGHAVQGRLLSDGRPLAEVKVRVLEAAGSLHYAYNFSTLSREAALALSVAEEANTFFYFGSMRASTTDAHGDFVIDNVPPGPWTLAVLLEGKQHLSPVNLPDPIVMKNQPLNIGTVLLETSHEP